MMRILWFCNMLLPAMGEALGEKTVPTGGWITGAMESICKLDEIHLTICCPVKNMKTVSYGKIEGADFACFPLLKNNAGTTDYLSEILEHEKPDVLHIWGTEYHYANIAAAVAEQKNIKVLVSIQGLCGACANHYFAGVPQRMIKRYTIRDLIRRDNLKKQYANFCAHGRDEQRLLGKLHYITGRTTLDFAWTMQQNPAIQYYACNETLRKSFYSHRWSLENCEKHSIFVSQWNYPIKAFHLMLNAFQIILKQYPDAKLYTTGVSPFERPFYRLTSYQKYIRDLIKEYGVEDRVQFTGVLDEKHMCAQYLKAHVFVSPSSIENSPNSVGEAMLVGMPIVASFVGGTMDMLKDKQEGFLYQADAPYMLAHYVEQYFQNDALAKRTAAAAHEHAAQTHDPRKNALRMLEIYKDVIADESKQLLG